MAPEPQSVINVRLPYATHVAVKEAVHQGRYASANAWVREAIDEKLARGATSSG